MTHDGDMSNDPSASMFLIDVIEDVSYGHGLSPSQANRLATMRAEDCVFVAADLLARMKLVYAAATLSGADADEEWAVGYAFRSVRAALHGEPAPPLLPS